MKLLIKLPSLHQFIGTSKSLELPVTDTDALLSFIFEEVLKNKDADSQDIIDTAVQYSVLCDKMDYDQVKELKLYNLSCTLAQSVIDVCTDLHLYGTDASFKKTIKDTYVLLSATSI